MDGDGECACSVAQRLEERVLVAVIYLCGAKGPRLITAQGRVACERTHLKNADARPAKVCKAALPRFILNVS
jgi:hypothetical protein